MKRQKTTENNDSWLKAVCSLTTEVKNKQFTTSPIKYLNINTLNYNKMKKLTSIAAALLLSVATFAQVPPQGFSYQAVLRDAQNNIIANQSVTVEITILQGANEIDALPVYNETHFTKTNPNGMLTLTVGKGETTGSFISINWGKTTAICVQKYITAIPFTANRIKFSL